MNENYVIRKHYLVYLDNGEEYTLESPYYYGNGYEVDNIKDAERFTIEDAVDIAGELNDIVDFREIDGYPLFRWIETKIEPNIKRIRRNK